MKAYPEYKNSEVLWLGEVPKHWEVKKLKFLGDAFIGITYSPDDVVENKSIGNLVLRSSNIQDGKLSLNDCVYVKKEISDKGITREGDILICSRNGSRALIGKNICIDKNIAGASFGAFMTIFRTEYYKFIYHYMNSQIFIGQSSLFLTSTINQLTITTLKCFQTALPPRDEQKKIASYLDHKTSQIDSLISKKKQMIDLLKEERAAIINHAVTKGINPDAEMKDSGVAWLGEVPKHWICGKLGYSVVVKARLGWKGLKASEYVENGYGLLATPNIKELEIDFVNINFITKERYDESPEIMLQKNDVLLVKDGSTLGIVSLIKELPFECTVNSSIAVLRPTDNIHSAYLRYFLESHFIQKHIQKMKGGMGVPHLFQDDINRFVLLFPPLKEQIDIAKVIENENKRLNLILALAEKEIALIEEYRTALINETVTGKIDIRDKVKG